jgi:hypothetical protein
VVTGNGGAVVTGAGGAVVTGAGGAVVTGAGGAAVTDGSNLLLTTVEPDYNWVELDATSGVQGAVYAYTDGQSCSVTEGVSICATQANCCIAGTTSDESYDFYGCGIGLELNSSGGTTAVKSAYDGSAKGFKVTIAGTFGGLEVRIAYTHASKMDGLEAPFKSITAAGTYTVLFTDAKCGAWTTADKCAATVAPYDLQIQVAGGNKVGTYDICVTDITPVY